MALWPFRRKSRRRRPDELRGRQSEPILSHRSQGVADATAEPNTSPARGKPTRQATEAQNKLQRRTRTYSFSPGRTDSIHAVRKKSTRGRGGPGLPQRSATGGYLAGPSGYNKEFGDKEVGGSGDTSPDAFGRVPTLHSKRDAEHLMPRKKSSKRRKNDHDREAEIKAMSNFVPVRPATDDWTRGTPMRKESRRVRTGLGFGFRGNTRQEWDKENRSSDISLPLAGSIHSGMSSDSEHVSWRVSAMEVLAPRPTLRYTVYPRHSAPGSDSTGQGQQGPARIPSQRRKLSEREPFPEAMIKAHKRIDNLADDLDASDLRELMERDTRRRQQKRQSDQEKVARRLARRAEKQKAEQAGRTDAQQSKNLERGVLGREAPALGDNPASAVVTSARRRPLSERTPPRSIEKQSDGAADVEMALDSPPQPLVEFHRTTSMQIDTPILPEEHNEPAPTASRSSKPYGALRAKKTRSKSPITSDEKTEASESWRKGSESGNAKGPLAWMSIFKWTNRNSRRNSDGPSSFSNTSRETMQTTQLPTPPVNYVSQAKLASGVPRRTMSRFREDLPETTLPSPSVSRVQSPEEDILPQTIEETSPDHGRHPEQQSTTPLLHSFDPQDKLVEAMRETPSTFSRLDEAQPSPEPQAMSLASVDSEASWLSGRIGGRRRTSSAAKTHHPYRQAQTTPSPKLEQETPGEDVSIVEDEYLSRYTPSQETPGWNRKSMGEGRPSSDGEGEEARWGAVQGHVPTVVQHHAVDRMKSREGLLNTFGEEAEVEGGSDDGQNSLGEASPSPAESPIEVQRAKSINFGKGHVRNFSAGSARLLDLTPRSSVDGKRRSVEPRL